jgi:bifunctional non-homologous end joining protein LigD
MPEICLQAARIVAGIGQGIASAMAQHVRNVAAYPPGRVPTKTTTLPSGSQWLHEIRHDGFRIIARKIDRRVRLYSRPGNDFTRRFPLIVEALARLRSRSCIIDGEAVACHDNGVASFDLIRNHRANDSVFLYAFDLIELNGDDLRRDPLEVCKATLASILAKARPGIRFNEHIEGDGPTVFAHACNMGLSVRGARPDWLKMKRRIGATGPNYPDPPQHPSSSRRVPLTSAVYLTTACKFDLTCECYVTAAPTVSAMTAPRVPSGFSGPTVESRAV